MSEDLLTQLFIFLENASEDDWETFVYKGGLFKIICKEPSNEIMEYDNQV